MSYYPSPRCLRAFEVVAALAWTALALRSAEPLTGRWLMTADFFGTPRFFRLDLENQPNGISGTYGGIKLTGTLNGSHLELSGKGQNGNAAKLTATLDGSTLSGSVTATDPGDPAPVTFSFRAVPAKPVVRGTPRRHEFTPTVFYRQYSPFNKPVLSVDPGDTIHTTTVDAGGADEHGIRRVAGGNPQTGPFYINGAMPGDTLVVHINRLRLNRDWAGSDDGIVQTASAPDLAIKTRDNRNSIRWHLDLQANTATPEPPSEHLKKFAIPLRPMLGCIAAAPSPGGGAPPTGDSGYYGGNMDFNEIGDGTTVYLPVSNPGALLYLGDAHALQGDGELNGNALETSMDVEFTVDVIAGKRPPGPRLETADEIMSMGLSGSLDDALREATTSMADWLMTDYKLTPSEMAQFMGVASQYKISEVADRNSGVVLKIRKPLLSQLGH
jgi:amidase